MSWIDPIIIISMLVLITVAGHVLTGRGIQGVSGFFRGNNNMPWWAVSASIIATKISALTFIALPAKVFVKGGNIEYALLIGGFIIGNFLMAGIFVKPYYDEDVYSPYDFISNRLHPNTAVLARLLFLVGTILSQAVRLLATAIVLQVISGMPILLCVVVIMGFSILWSWIGGIQTVIWTDVLLFLIFLLGGTTALYSIFSGTNLILPEMLRILDNKAKLTFLNFSLNPQITYTVWSGLIGAAVFELGSNAIDQVITQRIMCCRNVKQAKLAVKVSALSVVPTVIMLLVGLGITIFFYQNGLPEQFSYLLNPGEDGIFPYFVTNHMPAGLSSLIIAGMFASGISTLDSALTALSQTTVVGIRKSISNFDEIDNPKLLKRSRYFVGLWGIIILSITIIIWMGTQGSGQGLLDIGLQVPGFVYGSLLGLALLSLFRNTNWKMAFAGALVGCLATILLWILSVSFFWWYPVAAIITFCIGRMGTKSISNKVIFSQSE